MNTSASEDVLVEYYILGIFNIEIDEYDCIVVSGVHGNRFRYWEFISSGEWRACDIMMEEEQYKSGAVGRCFGDIFYFDNLKLVEVVE